MAKKTRQIALLRGINVGPHKRIAMPALRELLEGHGHEDVATHVQSGNILLTSTLSPAKLEQALQQQIHDGLGVDTPVIVRTRDELAAVIDANPIPAATKDPKLFQVSFLSAEPATDVVDRLIEADVAPEVVEVRGREVYAWHKDGIQRSKLARMLTDKRLGVTATARNWNTVTTLLALADETGDGG